MEKKEYNKWVSENRDVIQTKLQEEYGEAVCDDNYAELFEKIAVDMYEQYISQN